MTKFLYSVLTIWIVVASYAQAETTTQDVMKAAEQGLAKAQYNLGLMFNNGKGVKQDYLQCVSWYRKAAEQGHAKAQYNLGVAYTLGKGVKRDRLQAAL